LTAIPFIGRRLPSREKLLLKQYGLKKHQRLLMAVWGAGLAQVAVPVGSAVYFLVTQVRYEVGYNGSTATLFYLKDTWDRLPVHIDNLAGLNWFHTADQLAPVWWVVARHDFRKVLIGFLATLLVGAVTVGLKKRRQRTPLQMALSVPAALAAAGVTAGVLIAFFARAVPVVSQWGTANGVPYISEWLGRGQLELLAIGVLAGIPAKRVLARTFDTVQLMSIERNMAQGTEEKWWHKIVYPPNYRQRMKLLRAEDHEPQAHSRWLGMTLAVGAPVFVFLAVFGIWLNNWGPAAGVH